MMRILRNIVVFLLRTAVIIGVGAGFLLLGMKLAIGAPQAKPLSPKPPSWQHIATPSPYGKPHSRPKLNHRLPDESVGWKASAEPSASTNVAIPLTPPLPLRKPKKFRASVSRPKVATPVETTMSASPGSAATITGGSSSEHEISRSSPSDAAPPETEHASSEQAANQLSPQTPLGSLDVAVTEGLGENQNDENEKNAQNSISQPVPANRTAGAQFCDNISNDAADARFAWQKKLLKETEEKVSKRIAELNIRITEYRKWLARRNDFSRKAQGVIVNIYTKMKPDAAAQQLTILDEEMAAAVLTKLSSKAASAVMNEMDPKHAARLTAIISGAMAGPNNTPPPPRGDGT